MAIAFLLVVLFFGIVTIKLDNNNKKLKTQLNEALLNTRSTPVKELASNFRDFVQGIDGQISPEVEAAIKKLEEEDKPKALPAPVSAQATKKITVRYLFNKETWNLFWEEYSDEPFGDDAIKVVKHWGKKYLFNIEQQVAVTRQLDFPDERAQLRKYFEENHWKEEIK